MGCQAVFVATGDVSRIIIPQLRNDCARTDNLWRTTCFEIFWQPSNSPGYREFNLSPSKRWACYDFDDFRVGMRDAPANVEIAVSARERELHVVADIWSALAVPASVALNAIIEDADGVNRYWALAFAEGAPEFHSRVCRAITVTGAAS